MVATPLRAGLKQQMPANYSPMEMAPPGLGQHVRGRGDILTLARSVRPLNEDFLLFLMSDDLRLLQFCRLPSRHHGIHGFPLSSAIGLAIANKATGMIIVQERPRGYGIARAMDYELATVVRRALGETQIELLDYFLLVGDGIVSVGGLSIERD